MLPHDGAFIEVNAMIEADVAKSPPVIWRALVRSCTDNNRVPSVKRGGVESKLPLASSVDRD